MPQGQDYMVDVVTYPSKAIITFAEGPKMYMAIYYQSGTQYIYEMTIFLELHC